MGLFEYDTSATLNNLKLDLNKISSVEQGIREASGKRTSHSILPPRKRCAISAGLARTWVWAEDWVSRRPCHMGIDHLFPPEIIEINNSFEARYQN